MISDPTRRRSVGPVGPVALTSQDSGIWLIKKYLSMGPSGPANWPVGILVKHEGGVLWPLGKPTTSQTPPLRLTETTCLTSHASQRAPHLCGIDIARANLPNYSYILMPMRGSLISALEVSFTQNPWGPWGPFLGYAKLG